MRKLQDIMRDRGLTDQELASRIMSSQSTVYQWRQGTFLPRGRELIKLCETLQCSADDMLGISIERPATLNKALAVGLLKAITKNGEYTADTIHQIATTWRAMKGNRLTAFETWLRGIAEEVYRIELSTKKHKRKREAGVKQLTLL